MKVIFIDRDGVVNRDPGGWTEHGYVARWKDFHFLPGSKEAITRLTDAGYEIIIISNQGGISRGFFTMDDLNDINEKMLKEIEASGGKIRSVRYCPHESKDECGCKKPKTGLFEEAVNGINVDFSETFFIGDGSMDVEAGKRIGCKTVLLLSGKSKLKDVRDWRYKPDFIKKDLSEAVNWILSEAMI